MERFDPPHTAEATEQFVRRVLAKWGLEEMVLRGVTDNASVMVSAFEKLDMVRYPCVAHWLQLSLSDCLFHDTKADPGLMELLRKCRCIVAHFNRSPSALDALVSIQRVMRWGSILRPIRDVETRWNSTYLMLERLLELREALQRFAIDTEELEGDHWEGPKDQRFWKVLEEMVATLRPFLNATNKFQGDADVHVSISNVYPQILQLMAKLAGQEPLQLSGERQRAIANLQPGTQRLRQELLMSLEDRWGQGSTGAAALPLYKAAAGLDPRYKSHRLLHGPPGATDNLKAIVRDEVLRCVPHVLKAFGDQAELAAAARSVGVSSTQGGDGGGRSTDEGAADPDDEFFEPQPERQHDHGAASIQDMGAAVAEGLVEAEFEQFWRAVYGDKEFFMSRNESPVEWWAVQARAGHFKHLAICALSILSIPATSACVERLFSAAGQHVTELRTSLDPERLRQMLFISENWVHELAVLSQEEVKAYEQRHTTREAKRRQASDKSKRVTARVVSEESEGHGSKRGRGEVSSSDGEEEVQIVQGPAQTAPKKPRNMMDYLRK